MWTKRQTDRHTDRQTDGQDDYYRDPLSKRGPNNEPVDDNGKHNMTLRFKNEDKLTGCELSRASTT